VFHSRARTSARDNRTRPLFRHRTRSLVFGRCIADPANCTATLLGDTTRTIPRRRQTRETFVGSAEEEPRAFPFRGSCDQDSGSTADVAPVPAQRTKVDWLPSAICRDHRCGVTRGHSP
jgi:hypothetical protein